MDETDQDLKTQIGETINMMKHMMTLSVTSALEGGGLLSAPTILKKEPDDSESAQGWRRVGELRLRAVPVTERLDWAAAPKFRDAVTTGRVPACFYPGHLSYEGANGKLPELPGPTPNTP